MHLEGPEPIEGSVEDRGNGMYGVSYVATLAGRYQLCILNGAQTCPGVPPGAAHAWQCRRGWAALRSGLSACVQPQGRCCAPAPFTLQAAWKANAVRLCL